MKGFIVTLMSVALLNGAIGMISPEGDIKKYVRFLGALCLLCAIATPIYGAFADGEIAFDDLFFDLSAKEESYEQIYSDALREGAEQTLEVSVKSRLLQKFSLSEEDIDVEIYLEHDGEKYYTDNAEILLHDSAVFADPRDMTAFVNELCGCSCTVIYD